MLLKSLRVGKFKFGKEVLDFYAFIPIFVFNLYYLFSFERVKMHFKFIIVYSKKHQLC